MSISGSLHSGCGVPRAKVRAIHSQTDEIFKNVASNSYLKYFIYLIRRAFRDEHGTHFLRIKVPVYLPTS